MTCTTHIVERFSALLQDIPTVELNAVKSAIEAELMFRDPTFIELVDKYLTTEYTGEDLPVLIPPFSASIEWEIERLHDQSIVL